MDRRLEYLYKSCYEVRVKLTPWGKKMLEQTGSKHADIDLWEQIDGIIDTNKLMDSYITTERVGGRSGGLRVYMTDLASARILYTRILQQESYFQNMTGKTLTTCQPPKRRMHIPRPDSLDADDSDYDNDFEN